MARRCPGAARREAARRGGTEQRTKNDTMTQWKKSCETHGRKSWEINYGNSNSNKKKDGKRQKKKTVNGKMVRVKGCILAPTP